MEKVISTAVRLDPDARKFIRINGGVLYFWIGASGFMKVGYERPASVDFVELRGEGLALFQDKAIAAPSPELGWRVSLRPWPRRRIKVVYYSNDSEGFVDLVQVQGNIP